MPIFDEIDKIMQRQFKAFSRMLRDLSPEELRQVEPKVEERDGVRVMQWGPVIYGRTTTVGPDGRVHTQEWGNLPGQGQGTLPDDEFDPSILDAPPLERNPSPLPNPLPPYEPLPGPQPEPKLGKASDYLVDILDTKDGYAVIVDTPAACADDVEANVQGRTLQIHVGGKPFRQLELPTVVELKTIQFKNGIVELLLRSVDKQPISTPKSEST
jgi:HSP20 family molecular chaperone IbpA